MTAIVHGRRYEGWRLAAVMLLGIALVSTVGATLLLRGPFAWHVVQPEAWQGALEALLLFVTTLAGLHCTRLAKTVRVLIVALPILLYLRRHHVDAVLLVCLAYAEGLFALGALAARGFRDASEDRGRWLRWFLAGLALLSLVLWIAQIAGWGTPRAQRTVAFAVLLPALLWHRRLQTVQLLQAAWRLPTVAGRAWAAWLIVFPLVLFARSNLTLDFDSLWYGLRPERVLVGESGVFEPLGFSSPVHYFPKLYEVLLLPLSAMREDSVAIGLAIVCSALLARLAFDLSRRLQVDVVLSLAGAAAIWTIPALGGVALGAKPDALVALLVVAMVWFTLDLLEGRRARFAWIFGCAALAVSAKLVALPYAGVAGIAALVALRRTPPAAVGKEHLAGLFAIVSVAVALMCAGRTVWVAGLPTLGPEQLVQLWQALGMQRTSPVGMLEWARPQTWSDLPSIAVGWVLDPSRFSHLQISWPGNLFLFLPLAALIWGPARAAAAVPRWPLWPVPAVGLLLLAGIGFHNKGGDGNYFLAPVVLACVGGLALLARRIDTDARRAGLAWVLAVVTVFHFAYCFVSAAWSVGTRAWDLDFSRPNRDSPARHAEKLASFGLDGVARVLREAGGKMRVSGALPADAGFRLPARYEDLSDVTVSHLLDGDSEELLRLSACGGVQAMVIPTQPDEGPSYPQVRAAVDALRRFPAQRNLHVDGRWRLIDVRGALPACEHDPNRETAPATPDRAH